MENIFENVSAVYIGEPKRNLQTKPSSDTPNLTGCDVGSKEGDRGAISVSDRKSGNIVATLSISGGSLSLWWKQIRAKFHSDYKAMLYAVTHNMAVRILCSNADGEEGYIELKKPSDIRNTYRMLHYIPRFKIVGNDGTPYVIKRGKVRPMRTYIVDESFSQLAKHKDKMS